MEAAGIEDARRWRDNSLRDATLPPRSTADFSTFFKLSRCSGGSASPDFFSASRVNPRIAVRALLTDPTDAVAGTAVEAAEAAQTGLAPQAIGAAAIRVALVIVARRPRSGYGTWQPPQPIRSAATRYSTKP